MSGLKSCSEIFKYMHRSENRIITRDGDGMVLSDGCLKADGTETVVSPFLSILLYFELWCSGTNFNDFYTGRWCTEKIKIFTQKRKSSSPKVHMEICRIPILQKADF